MAKMIWFLTLIVGVLSNSLFDVDTDGLIDNECCDLTFANINNMNDRIRPKISELMNEDYFKHYQFSLDLNCPFYECESICFSPGCQLDLDVHSNDYNYDLLDNNGDQLGNLNEDSFLDSLCSKDEMEKGDDNEWCDLNNENGVIIDISRNPERFTGYIPTPERNIWSMIYQNQIEGECPIEQKVFYQMISGFHSSVSTHLSNEWYNKETETWEPNLELFNFKVGDHKERISNIYFNYALLVRSIIKISPFLKNYKLNPFNEANNKFIHKEIKSIVKELPTSLNVFNEDLMFQNIEIKDEFQRKFKNVTRLMDCVTCDRCRLWGKIQSTGYATSLKILFNNDEKILNNLTKNEIASLFNTFDRLTKSISAINNFNYLNVKKNEEANALLTQQQNESSKEIKSSIPKEESSIKEKFYDELNLVQQALQFIWASYINLPNNLKNLVLYKSHQWWDRFMGLKENKDNIEYLRNIVVT